MNNTSPAQFTALPAQTTAAQTFVQVENRPEVEMISVSGFLSKVPHEHPWQLQSVIRFGNMISQLAKAMAIEYRLAMDPFLGPVQVFPETLVMKVYKHLAPSLGWPRLLDFDPVDGGIPQNPEKPKPEARIAEGMVDYLRGIAVCTKDAQTKAAAKLVLRVVERETAQIREKEAASELETACTPAP